MFMIYHDTKFNMPSSNDVLVITLKPKSICRFCMVATLFYILRKYYLCKNYLFSKELLPHKI